MANEVKRIKEEIGQWVTEKEDAMEIVAILVDKFSLNLQDFVDKLAEMKSQGYY